MEAAMIKVRAVWPLPQAALPIVAVHVEPPKAAEALVGIAVTGV
jgi:Zn-dependent alcohol dehydrogenase